MWILSHSPEPHRNINWVPDPYEIILDPPHVFLPLENFGAGDLEVHHDGSQGGLNQLDHTQQLYFKFFFPNRIISNKLKFVKL